jgi:two-component system chemotaxis response regulator CheB
VLYEQTPGTLPHYQCSVGHAYSHESLVGEHGRKVEQALWTAIRSLDDRAALFDRMADRARESGNLRVAAAFTARAEDVRGQMDAIRVVARFDEAGAEEPERGASPVSSEA